MTELYIDGKSAILPEGFNISFISENPYFTRSSNYSLDVELPMPANHTIFRHISRLDVTKTKTILPATLMVDNRTLLRGSAVLLSVEDTLLKVQLVSGNAEFNLLTNDDIYIDELDLGKPTYRASPYSSTPANKASHYFGSVDEVNSVWLPVFYQEAKPEQLYNKVHYEDKTDDFYFGVHNAVQPYLMHVIRLVVEHFGYTFDGSFFDDNFLRHVYICNAVVNNLLIAPALPHWTVSEFFTEIEKFLGAVTVVDERSHTVRLESLTDYYRHSDREVIDRAALLKEYSAEIGEQKSENDITIGNVNYELPSHTNDGYLKLKEDIISYSRKKEFATYGELAQNYASMTQNEKEHFLFIAGGRFYINYKDDKEVNSLREVNLYGDLVREDAEVGNGTSLKIVPAKIVEYEIGTYKDGAETKNIIHTNVPVVGFYSFSRRSDYISHIQEAIEGKEEVGGNRDNYKTMEVAISTGCFYKQNITSGGQNTVHQYACPFTDFNQNTENRISEFPRYSLSLHDLCPDSIGHRLHDLTPIRTNIPYTIQFLADKMPDVNKVFLIGNKQYLCEKIEAEIDTDGLNKVLKGTFYRIE